MTGDYICCLSVLGEPIIGRGSGRRAAALCRILKRRKNSFENTKTGSSNQLNYGHHLDLRVQR